MGVYSLEIIFLSKATLLSLDLRALSRASVYQMCYSCALLWPEPEIFRDYKVNALQTDFSGHKEYILCPHDHHVVCAKYSSNKEAVKHAYIIEER